MELQQAFEAATLQVKELKYRPSNEELLNLYALFKQATSGDAPGDSPPSLDLKAIAKQPGMVSPQGNDSRRSKESLY